MNYTIITPPRIPGHISPIVVRETIQLRDDFASIEGAREAGQAYDDIADENAHHADGYVDHAEFLFRAGAAGTNVGAELELSYLWRDFASLSRLLATEDELLAPWFRKYAVGPRKVEVFVQLPVDV